MSGLRLFALAVILGITSIAWMILGGSVEFRTHDVGTAGANTVGMLWGGQQAQRAPGFRAGGDSSLHVTGSEVTADLQLEQRKRGLLWYATYTVDFSGAYRLDNDGPDPLKGHMSFAFPSADGVYDGFVVKMDDTPIPVTYSDGSAEADFIIPADSTVTISTAYRSRGQDEWRYVATNGVEVLEDFSLTMTTDFDEFDFPDDAVSPTAKEDTGDGWKLTWDYDSVVSGRPVALTMPTPLNPGPVASRISFFAPVSLLFYFAAMVLLTTTRRVRIHPMNYAFLAAGFFAFHLLFAYLVDRIALGAAFGIAAVVSLVLCVGYIALAVDDRRTVLEAAVAQSIFLVLFSFSFFLEGFTGLAITVGAILTLAYFMLRTARVDWGAMFARPEPPVPNTGPAPGGYVQK